jgi:hypothetical protein
MNLLYNDVVLQLAGSSQKKNIFIQKKIQWWKNK